MLRDIEKLMFENLENDLIGQLVYELDLEMSRLAKNEGSEVLDSMVKSDS